MAGIEEGSARRRKRKRVKVRLLKVAVITIGMTIIGATFGYQEGKHQADRYYASYNPKALDRAWKLSARLHNNLNGVEIKMGDPVVVVVSHSTWTGTEATKVEDAKWYCKDFGCVSVSKGAIVEFDDWNVSIPTCLKPCLNPEQSGWKYELEMHDAKPEGDHQSMKWKAVPQIYGPTDRVGHAPIACDPTWNKDGKPVCSQSEVKPSPPLDDPNTFYNFEFEEDIPTSSSSDYHYGEDPDIGNQTTPYHPSFPKEPKEPKECKPTPYWVICDDGFVIFGKAISDDSLRARVCGKHGGVDNRQIHTVATLGKDWKVIVTPINPPISISDMPDILHYKDH